MSIRKFLYKALIFVFVMIGGGLMQYWAPMTILVVVHGTLDWQALIRDGGLFFFATTLIAANVYSLFDQHSIREYGQDVVISLFLGIIPSVAIAIVYAYTAMKALESKVPYSYPDIVIFQVSVVTCSVVFSFYTAIRTGRFAT